MRFTAFLKARGWSQRKVSTLLKFERGQHSLSLGQFPQNFLATALKALTFILSPRRGSRR